MKTNWAGNVVYQTTEPIQTPSSLSSLQTLVKNSSNVRVVGTHHSFTALTDSTGTLISLKNLNKILDLDEKNLTLTVEAGATYADIAVILHSRGYAVHNLPSHVHFTIAGAVVTGTHGSGNQNRNLSSAVTEMVLITANGELMTISKDHDDFYAVVISLGLFGVVYKLTLQIQPTFYLSQRVYENLPFENLKDHFNEIMSSGYSVSLFTTLKKLQIDQIWVKKIIQKNNQDTNIFPPDLFGATINTQHLHPHKDQPPSVCSPTMGSIGTWYEILPLIKMYHEPQHLNELQSEYFLNIEYAYEAIKSLENIYKEISAYLVGMEIRTIVGDNIWMSPCYRRNCVAIHCTWSYDYSNVIRCVKLIEEVLAPWKPLPHWSKLFTLPPAVVQAGYPKFSQWKKLAQKYDPTGKFRNPFLLFLLWRGKSSL